MSTSSNLSEQVTAYHRWKRQLLTQIRQYGSWLQSNDLLSEDARDRLRHAAQTLGEDQLTIAFVGEFSRGKTELINSLFFASYQQRMLPSEAGRTTMCPTEVFYDTQSGDSYLMLLPVESRLDGLPLRELRRQPDAWERQDLNPDDPDSTREALARVAEVKSVHRDEARNLGFDETTLDPDYEREDHIFIPAWRHAMISLHHPLLERGLRVLDTPGLNALGSEPELTISLLPEAQAVVFLLSVDTGVTASDLSIWQDHINTNDSDHQAGRFVVLNKIDVLWDELRGDDATRQSIERVQSQTAQQLKVPPEDVIPVSAKQGLIGSVRGDQELRERSRLPELENLIIERILAQKEELITQNLVSDLLAMIRNSKSALQDQMDSLLAERDMLEQQSVDHSSMKDLAGKTREAYEFYHRKLITLRSSRRLIQSQGDILARMLCGENFDELIEKTRKSLQDSWSTAGMNRAMDYFFHILEQEFSHLMVEGRRAEKMVKSIYDRYNRDSRGETLQPIPLRFGRYLLELRDLRQKAERFRRDPRSLLSGQSRLINRFFDTMVSEARDIHARAREDIERWPGDTMLPIMQYSSEQKRLLEHQVRRLRDLSEGAKTIEQKREDIERALDLMRGEMEQAENLQREIRQPPPSLSKRKVVSISGIA